MNLSEQPQVGFILYLFCRSGFVAASDSREKLRRIGDLRINCCISDGVKEPIKEGVSNE